MIPPRKIETRTTGRPSGLAGAGRWLTIHSEAAFLAFLAGFLFLVATNTQTGWLYVVTALLAGLLWAGYANPRSALRDLQARRRMPSPARQGDEACVELELHNPGSVDRLLLNLELTLPDSLPGEPRTRRILIERLPAGQTVRVSHSVACTLRGYHHFPAVRLSTGTPLGLFPCSRRAEGGQAPLIVYPRGPHLADSTNPCVSRSSALRHRTSNRPGSSEDFLGIRPYQAGEDIRFIHWPATARTGQVMLREFRGQAGQGRAVLIDNSADWIAGTPEDSNLEAAISAAAALVDLARRQRVPLTLLAQQGGGLTTAGRSEEAALDFLARLGPTGRLSWSSMLAELSRAAPGPIHLCLLTCRPLEPGADLEGLSARRGGLEVVFFPPRGGPSPALEAYEAGVSELRTAGVRARVHHPGQDLAETLGSEARP